MIENPFLTPPQVPSGKSESWSMGFAFGFQGPAESTMTPADIDPPDADALTARIQEDVVGYLRTVSLKQIEGATGFQYLSEDLNERVRARSDGVVRELIIQGLIVE